MSEPDKEAKPLVTFVMADFAGRRRKLQLRIGEIGELERLCEAGIGAIMLRLATHSFKWADVRETIRLGLEGGGASEVDATALVMRYVDDGPLMIHAGLAANVLKACLEGVEDDAPKKETAEGATGPETSPPSTKQAA